MSGAQDRGRRRTQVTFTVTILVAFALLFLLAVGLVVAGYRRAGGQAGLATAELSLSQAAEAAAANMRAMLRPVLALAAVLPELAPLDLAARPDGRATAAMLALLAAEPAVQAVSIGLDDGRLRQALRAEALGGRPAGATHALREAGGGAPERWTWLDAAGRPLASEQRPASDEDPRRAQWYLQAQDGAVHVSTLYDLPLLGVPGLSVSRRVPGGGAVLALDVTLAGLAGFLAQQHASPRSLLFLFTEDGILLAHERPELAMVPLGGGRSGWTTLAASPDPLLRRIWRAYAEARLPPGQTRPLAGPAGPLLVQLAPVRGLAEPQVLVAVVAPVADFTATVAAGVRDGTILAGCALLGGLAAIGILAWRIARPLGHLTQEAKAIRRLDFDGAVPVVSRITEIARLSEAMEGMKAALRLFGVYVPRDLVGKLLERGEAARIGGERRRITVLFSDIDGFTTLAEGLPPEELMRITSDYFEVVTQALLAHHATIDKYIGDAVMALWNAPADDPKHARNACLAALTLHQLTEALAGDFAARGWPPLRTRLGVHTGDAVVGNVGAPDRMAYTAIGAMVNIASRLEGLNKFYRTRVLIPAATRAAAGPGFVTRPLDLVLAKGSTTPLEVHELLGLAPEPGSRPGLVAAPRLLAALPAWERMVAHYRAGRFAAAEQALAEAGLPADDPAAALYAERLGAMRGGTPADWSPVVRFATK